MSLESGSKLGSYEILSAIGAGGMGEVYRARDVKLGREVAIKVLPEELSRNAERLARFEREAKLLASLNHSGIATLHAFEEDRGTRFLVMELVEGETLESRIKRGPIRWDEASPLFIQIAEALEAAHEKRIVHRDLKPANVMITPEGKIKILDFGLAKAFQEEALSDDSSQSPTLTRGTALGVILGTASYMSPEQARGKTLDRRTDNWAFGCCLYEALTGRKAFEGETVTDTLAKVVQNEPDWERLPGGSPRRLLERCLRKEVRKRLQHIGDARVELEEPVDVVTKRRPAIRSLIAAALAGALAAGLAAWTVSPSPRAATDPLRRFSINTPPGVELQTSGFDAGSLAVSRDGNTLVYVGHRDGTRELYRRRLDESESTRLGDTRDAHAPFFSPDGEWVGFFSGTRLKKVPLTGGGAFDLAEARNLHAGAFWGVDGNIYYGMFGDGIWRVPEGGGEREQVTALEPGSRGHGWPSLLPGGEFLLYASIGIDDESSLLIRSMKSGRSSVLLEVVERYQVAGGQIVFIRGDSAFAVSFDARRGKLSGESRVVPGLGQATYEIASDGTLFYVPWIGSEANRSLVWISRQGEVSPVTRERRAYFRQPQLSPDGRLLALTIQGRGGPTVWVLDLERGSFSRLTLFGVNVRPIWSPDGSSIYFTSDRDGGNFSPYVKSADGSGQATKVAVETGSILSITSDGRRAIFRSFGASTGSDIGVLDLDGSQEPEMLLETAANEGLGRLSPDEQWLAYVSDESGRDEIYVRPFPALDRRVIVSTNGGDEPVWSHDGRELFYLEETRMMAVAIETEPDFEPGLPKMLFEHDWMQLRSSFDVAADGRFITIRDETPPATSIQVVLNWTQQLEVVR